MEENNATLVTGFVSNSVRKGKAIRKGPLHHLPWKTKTMLTMTTHMYMDSELDLQSILVCKY